MSSKFCNSLDLVLKSASHFIAILDGELQIDNFSKKVNAMATTPLGIGIRVVRGPDWKWEDQDGGEGHSGTVVELLGSSQAKTQSPPEGTVILQWDVGSRNNYRVGHQSAYDLRVIDNAPIGIKHPGVVCSACGGLSGSKAKFSTTTDNVKPDSNCIVGIRWNCSTCSTNPCDLCTPCYMSDKHNTSHEFLRIDQPGKEAGAVLVGKRSDSRRVLLRGIYPGAKVSRGHDWNWKDQDGGPGKLGKVLDIQGWDDESGRSVANIAWSSSGITNVYRIGHKGKVDVRIASGHSAATNGHYYPDHLPVLGKLNTVSVSLRNAETIKVANFKTGDRVQVNVTVETLKNLQDGHGGFNPKMAETIGRIGTVHRITRNGDVRVQYPGSPVNNNRWTIHPAALTKVTSFVTGQTVKVVNDIELVKTLQSGHGEWIPTMKDALGKTGRIVTVYADGDVRVTLIGHTWTFNPACLVPVEEEESVTSRTSNSYEELRIEKSADSLERIVAAGDLLALKDRIQGLESNNVSLLAAFHSSAQLGHYNIAQFLALRFPDLTNRKHQGKGALHVSAHQGHLDVVEMLLDDAGADIHLEDDDGDSALHYSAFGRKMEIMKSLLNRGANPNAKNLKGCSVLHVCVVMQHIEAVKLLINQPTIDVNTQDVYGDTPLHEAILKEYNSIAEIFCSLDGIDLTLSNKRGFNSLQYAALKGNAYAVGLILDKEPSLASSRKMDGYTSLHLSALNGHLDVTKLLLEKGNVDVMAVDDRRQNALHSAVHQGQAAIIEYFMNKIPQRLLRDIINAKGIDGDTPLHITLSREGAPLTPASKETSPGIVQLIEKALRDGVSESCSHPIAIAAFLILKGGDVTIKNNKNHSPQDLVTDYMARAFLLEYTTTGRQQPDQIVDEHPDMEPNPAIRPQEDKSGMVECGVCSELVVPVKFLPCGHAIVCKDCSSRMKKCFQCKTTIDVKADMEATDQGSSDVSQPVIPQNDQDKCTICMERNHCIVFNCGHLSCAECMETLRLCHMCREPIQIRIKMYR